ncbi:MAG: YibE/F family protein [Winkia neuii]|uniref:YibE/F family protein n=1 Tax=Winkia neuii TaxID=33007 RepID=A0A2I1IQ59_9ACTO|nr:YibE/F family protein [Winkia neuii]OFJ72259.1 hypothetical protein HMPREF2851_04860 [Actinomyces sp. HMSC064C12]OFK01974.1 hypothetical protein HMPREF2835_08095 [Actinomyces sp. HMSC072A03]OFT54530.1 hypothetical protein HMPREF3152_08620 [Actinomyces sp. HMSC06A08]KWZ74340.1 YibE/F-like protein [Winkia neuii]MDK8098758.1 YibE/F family protein [Winkia neuii]
MNHSHQGEGAHASSSDPTAGRGPAASHRHASARHVGSHHLHAHLSAAQANASTSPVAKWALLSFLAAIAVATLLGLVLLWPNSSQTAALRQVQKNYLLAPSATLETVQVIGLGGNCGVDASPSQGEAGTASPSASPDSPETAASPASKCRLAQIKVLTGKHRDETDQLRLAGPAANAGISSGDKLSVMRLDTPAGVQYSFMGVHRSQLIGVFAAMFALAVLAVARWKGLFALVGLGVAGAVLMLFMLPSLVCGNPGVWVGLVAGSAIMFVVVFIAHGFSLRTCAALAGTLVALAVSTGLGAIAVYAGRLSGFTDETELNLAARLPGLDFRQLAVAALVLAGVGVLNDVTITQASAVWELRAAAPHYSRWELYRAGMRIGRDHIASTIYTIVFAYAGAALSTLLLLVMFYNQSLQSLLASEDIGAEALRTLASATGLVLAVPLTTAIAAGAVKRAELPQQNVPQPQRGLSH